jgi:hypothetical protein
MPGSMLDQLKVDLSLRILAAIITLCGLMYD